MVGEILHIIQEVGVLHLWIMDLLGRGAGGSVLPIDMIVYAVYVLSKHVDQFVIICQRFVVELCNKLLASNSRLETFLVSLNEVVCLISFQLLLFYLVVELHNVKSRSLQLFL